MNEDYIQRLYARAVEVQDHLHQLAMDFKATGMSDEQVAIELSFSMLHEGYRMKHVEDEMKKEENYER